MKPSNIGYPGISGYAGDDINADSLEIIPNNPGFAGEIEIAQDIDAEGTDLVYLTGARKAIQRFARSLISIPLGALESF
jgi:hypothetical protein